MKIYKFTLLALCLFVGLISCDQPKTAVKTSVVPAIAPEPVSFHEYFARREWLINNSEGDKVAYLLKSADNANQSLYRQEANFVYFTGIYKPSTYILMTPQGVKINDKLFTTVIFTRDTLLLQERPHFESHGETVVNIREFNDVMSSVFPTIETLYVSGPEMTRFNDWLNGERVDLLQLSGEKLHKRYVKLKILPFTSLGSMREVKSGSELANICYAIAITEEALRNVWSACTPGITENEIQGIIEYQFAKYDARQFAFYPIIGTGVNGLLPHYMDNNATTKDGEMIVMDLGARYHGYCADITRTFPVSGKFTQEQTEAYGALLEVQKKLIEAVRPGVSLKEINRLSDQLITEAGYIKYRLHSMTHHLGLETHDFETDTILRSGHVITIEPGIYIPANATELPEGFRGMGIRIEDDVLVTDTGYEVLSRRIPKEIADIEAAMNRPRK